MSDVVLNKDHVAQGLSLLTSQYQKSKIRALFSVFLRRTQKVEQMLYDIWFYLLFPNARGDQLDQYGILLREKRAGRGDDEYRTALIVKLRVMRSKGQPRDIVDISILAVGKDGLKYSEPVHPGRDGPLGFFRVDKEAIQLFQIPSLKKALKRGKSVGVRGELVYSLSTSGDLFRFSSVHATSIGRGMSSIHDTSFSSKFTSAEIL